MKHKAFARVSVMFETSRLINERKICYVSQ